MSTATPPSAPRKAGARAHVPERRRARAPDDVQAPGVRPRCATPRSRSTRSAPAGAGRSTPPRMRCARPSTLARALRFAPGELPGLGGLLRARSAPTTARSSTRWRPRSTSTSCTGFPRRAPRRAARAHRASLALRVRPRRGPDRERRRPRRGLGGDVRRVPRAPGRAREASGSHRRSRTTRTPTTPSISTAGRDSRACAPSSPVAASRCRRARPTIPAAPRRYTGSRTARTRRSSVASSRARRRRVRRLAPLHRGCARSRAAGAPSSPRAPTRTEILERSGLARVHRRAHRRQRHSASRGSARRPAPDTFIAACRMLAVPPEPGGGVRDQLRRHRGGARGRPRRRDRRQPRGTPASTLRVEGADRVVSRPGRAARPALRA